MRVLIVDDEVGICKYLKRELQKEDYEVAYTTSPAGVLEKLKKAKKNTESYDLLLLDILMPGIDGLSLLKEIQNAQLDLDVIITTGHGDEDKAIESIRLGAVDYLRKPISLEELHTAIFRVQQKRKKEAKKEVEHSILVVDDEKELCAYIKRELYKEGYQVVVVHDGDEGLEYFKNNRVDVALVDLKMPRMDGLEMLKRCREITNDFVSIIITGYGDYETAIKALKLGVINYLKKPLLLDELVNAVNNSINMLLLHRGLSARRRELEIETALKERYAKNLEKMVEERTREIRKLSDAVKAATESIVISDLEWKITDVNEATLKMYGTDNKEDLIGKSLFDFIAPEDRERTAAGMKEVMEKGYIIDQEYHVIIKDGSKLPVEMSSSLMKGTDGKPMGFVSVTKDVTERKRVKAELEEAKTYAEDIIANFLDTLIVTDPDGNIRKANQAALDLLEYNEQELIGKPIGTIFAKEGAEELKSFFTDIPEALFKREVIRNYELTYVTKSGRRIPMSFNCSVMRDEKGEILGLVVGAKDISRTKEVEAQLRQTQKMEAVGQLSGGVAHDFNNVLTAILGCTELALMTVKEDNPLYQDLNEIRKASIHAANLTRQLLLFSRRQPMELIPVELNKLIKELFKMLNRLIGEDISLITDLEPDLWWVKGDKGTLEQVIVNLVVNARDAMPNGGKITIKIRNAHVDQGYCKDYRYARPGRFIFLSVQDTGTGMDQATIDRIFEPFFTTKASGKGAGMGLSVVYGIVKYHEGWVNVESSPDNGSIFGIYLPAVSRRPEEERKSPVSLEALRGRGERILLVEDEEVVREFATRVLSRNGYAVFTAANAQEAIDIFQKKGNNFDLIFSDVVLPDGSGPKLVEQLLKLKPGISVLFTSGYSDEKSDWRTIRKGGHLFLKKPYLLADLLRTMRDALTM